jgi:hypothetical protein
MRHAFVIIYKAGLCVGHHCIFIAIVFFHTYEETGSLKRNFFNNTGFLQLNAMVSDIFIEKNFVRC